MKLGNFPTPTERRELRANADAPAGPIWIKREDLSGTIYGGNKVRRLETALEAARAQGKSRIVTVGAVGSHHVLATAIYGAKEGFRVEAFLVAQPDSPSARKNIACAIEHGLVAHPTHVLLLPRARLALGRDAFYIPLGGSSVEGAVAAATAVDEITDEFDWIVTALGSGGTAAGLAAGLSKRGHRARVLAVCVSPPPRLVGLHAHYLYRRAAHALGAPAPASRLVIDRAHVGHGYGFPTREGAEAGRIASELGLRLDATYTEKAFAAALALRGRAPDARILFLHTCGQTPPLSNDDSALPPELEHLFAPIQIQPDA